MTEQHAHLLDANTSSESVKFLAQLFGNQELVDAIDDGRQFRWAAKNGITTEELAICLPLAVMTITGQNFQVWARIYDLMPSNCQRHFTVINASETTAANPTTENPSQQAHD